MNSRLGSSTYLTDNFGRPSHYYETLPFGEMMVEHNQSKYYKVPYPTTNTGSYDNKFKFNGKELDDATGLYYYGARYYDPRISIFVSVDPLAEQTMEPYLYAGNNPIRYTDPTGMAKDDIININLQTKEVEIIKQKGDDVVNFIDGNGDLKDQYTYGENGSFSKDFNYRKGTLKGNGQEFMSLQTSKNAKAHELFDFISKNSDVEFERLRLNGYKNADSSTDVSIIGTTFEKATTAYGAYMLPYLEKEGLALKAHWHNHPSGTIRPSGYNVDNSIDFEASGDAPGSVSEVLIEFTKLVNFDFFRL